MQDIKVPALPCISFRCSSCQYWSSAALLCDYQDVAFCCCLTSLSFSQGTGLFAAIVRIQEQKSILPFEYHMYRFSKCISSSTNICSYSWSISIPYLVLPLYLPHLSTNDSKPSEAHPKQGCQLTLSSTHNCNRATKSVPISEVLKLFPPIDSMCM